jgi:hypothetical protein
MGVRPGQPGEMAVHLETNSGHPVDHGNTGELVARAAVPVAAQTQRPKSFRREPPYPHDPSGSAGKTAAGRDDGWAPGPEVQLMGDVGTRGQTHFGLKTKAPAGWEIRLGLVARPSRWALCISEEFITVDWIARVGATAIAPYRTRRGFM